MINRTPAIIPPPWAGEPVRDNLEGWPVVQRFEPQPEVAGIGLVDLSHRPKALLQGTAAAEWGQLKPGQALWTGQAFVGCLTPGEAVLFDLSGPLSPGWPDPHYTDMTEAWVLLGLWGAQALQVVQRLVAVDVERPDINGPIYLTAASHGSSIQILNPKGRQPGFLLACARSEGQLVYDQCLHAGKAWNIRPLGTKAFAGWLQQVT
jgi:hypothetical protein